MTSLKNIIKGIIFLIPFWGLSQNFYIYNYYFLSNNSKNCPYGNTIMALNLQDKQSIFSPLDYINIGDENNFIKKDFTNIEIVKNWSEDKIYVFIPLFSDMYAIDTPSPKWIIHKEKKYLLGHEVIKATTTLGGREWISWFSSNLPENDGPYIFKGLPGMILEIYDEKKEHHFLIKDILNSDEKLSIKKYIKPTIHISLEDFKKKWIDYQKDPIKEIRLTLLNAPNQFSMYNTDGTSLSSQEIIRMKEKEANKFLYDNNNHINLFLLKKD